MKQTPLQFSKSKSQPKREYKPFVPGPNPELPDFIKRHATPYDPESDKYDVPAFDKDLIVHKHNKLYTMHIYWSKKDPTSISEYIKHFTKPGDVVLDPFAGSGTTGCASVTTRRHAVLIDVSASASFLAHHYCLSADKNEVKASLDVLLGQGREKTINDLYATRCDRCGGQALTEFMVWSDSYQCPNCAEILALYDCPEVQVPFPDGSRKKKRVCPICLQKSGNAPQSRFVISTRSKKFEPRAVACKYTCLGKCRPKGKMRFHNDSDRTAKEHFLKYDLPSALSVKREDIRAWYPKRPMMDVPNRQKVWGIKWRAGSANFKRVADLFTSLDSHERLIS